MTGPTLPVLPALRWADGEGYGLDRAPVRAWLEEGVVGFILFGGNAQAAREATDRLGEQAGRPLVFGADLERGAGQQFEGATALPPLAALAAAGDRDRLFQAGALTGREATALGVPWVFAPVADLAVEARNPIVGTRSPGADPNRVAEAVRAWIEGCLSVGALPCVKHFPGHGRTLEDSHRTLPRVEADRATLTATDQLPFREAIAAGVPSVMTAHVAYPALDPSGRPGTRSRPIIMDGAGEGATWMVEALQAGVDLLIYPPADLPVGEILRAAGAAGRLNHRERERSRARVERFLARAARATAPSGRGWGSATDRGRALGWAAESLVEARWTPAPPASVELTVVDDDVGGPYPAPSREPFVEALRGAGVVVVPAPGPEDAFPILCVYAEPRGWKGRSGLSAESRARVRSWAQTPRRPGGVVAFGGPTRLVAGTGSGAVAPRGPGGRAG